MHKPVLTLIALALAVPAAAEVKQRTVNNGNLVMEDVPEISAEIVTSLNRYQNVRSAAFETWSADGQSLFIDTRFGDVGNLHRVDMPGGARHQITFFDEPVGQVARQPGGSTLLFTRDAGGSEFAQIFQLDPAGGDARMLTDGESRNGGVVWDREGRVFAYQSTARNGASNDIWLMDPEAPEDRKIVLESPDGTLWAPAEFSKSGSKILVANYVSITDSRVNLLDLDTGDVTLLAGGAENPSVNLPMAFDDGKLERWTFSEVGGLDTSTFREPELIEYPTFDQVDGQQRMIPAWLYKPAGPGPHPVIISIHGGPESQSRPWFSSTYQLWLEKLGVAVLVPNVRGSAGYGKTYVALDNGFKREDSV